MRFVPLSCAWSVVRLCRIQRGDPARIVAREPVVPIHRNAGLCALGGAQLVLPAPDQIRPVAVLHLIWGR